MKYSRKLITNNSRTSCLGKFFKVFLGGGIRETGKNNFRNRGIVYSWLHEVRAWRWAARQGLSQSARVNSQPNQFRRLRPDQFLIWRPLSTHKQAPPLDTLAPPTRGGGIAAVPLLLSNRKVLNSSFAVLIFIFFASHDTIPPCRQVLPPRLSHLKLPISSTLALPLCFTAEGGQCMP